MPSQSLGFLYEAATLHCGFGFLDAGKTMGLGAFGNRPLDPLPIECTPEGDIISPIDDGLDEADVSAAWQARLAERFGGPCRPATVFDPLSTGLRWRDDTPKQHGPDVAAAAQDAIERCMRGLAADGQRTVGSPNLVLAGGVALNCEPGRCDPLTCMPRSPIRWR